MQELPGFLCLAAAIMMAVPSLDGVVAALNRIAKALEDRK